MRGFFDARRAMQLLSLVLAAAAAAYLLAVATYSGTATTEDGETAEVAATLVDINGRWVIAILLAPVLLIGTHALWQGRGRTVAILVCTLPVLLFSLAGMLTVGIFFMPAVIASGLSLVVPAHATNGARPVAPHAA